MVKRVPFTLILIITVLLSSLITGSIFRSLPPNIEKNVAFNIQNFSLSKSYTILTMILFAKDPLMIFGLLIISIGSFIYEYKYKTIKTIILFFSAHLTGIFGVLFLSALSISFVTNSDVGASIGFWGVTGAVAGYLKYKKIILLSLMSFLVLYVFFRHWDLASVEHPAAFFSGMIYQKIIENYEQSKK